ncbi:MAG: DUF72 domain-containing protein [Planctomycetia bacterium]|nr:DUF72 domain-containing protein [Planctomycetia bacterium]
MASSARTTEFFVGTSGYSYPKWKPSFYPQELPQKEMLGYYAERFGTVEINNTFYRLPSASVVAAWGKQVPGTFRFVLKASQTITHRKRLSDVSAETVQFLRIAGALKRRLGPLLFQLPPNCKLDLPRLETFLKLLPRRTRAAIEFRHESWLTEETFALLRKHACALCVADADELPSTPLVETASWGLVRLRREKYTDAQLRTWIKRIRAQAWNQAYVFFKHEDTGTGPKFASRFLKLAAT